MLQQKLNTEWVRVLMVNSFFNKKLFVSIYVHNEKIHNLRRIISQKVSSTFINMTGAIIFYPKFFKIFLYFEENLRKFFLSGTIKKEVLSCQGRHLKIDDLCKILNFFKKKPKNYFVITQCGQKFLQASCPAIQNFQALCFIKPPLKN